MARTKNKKWSFGSIWIITLIGLSRWCYAGDMPSKMHPGAICTCPEFCKISSPAHHTPGGGGHDCSKTDKRHNEHVAAQLPTRQSYWLINPDCGGPLRANRLFSQPDTFFILPSYLNTSPIHQVTKFPLHDLILSPETHLQPPFHPPESIC